MASPPFTRERLDSLVAETGIVRVEFHEEIASTSTRGMELARQGEIGPLLVLAARQTAGRGRGGKAWWSGEGGLTFSLLTNALPQGDHSARLALAVGVALCEALEPFAGAQPLQLKWPNDIMVRGRKLAGVLIEVPGGAPPRAVIGIGLNVGRLDQAPPDVQTSAISLAELQQEEPDKINLLKAILPHLNDVLEELTSNPAGLADRWRQHSFLDGRHVEIELPGGGRLEGLAQSIDDAGALLVSTDSGEESCRSGIVASWGEAALGG